MLCGYCNQHRSDCHLTIRMHGWCPEAKKQAPSATIGKIVADARVKEQRLLRYLGIHRQDKSAIPCKSFL